MKVIGTAGDSWDQQYICTINHKEIEKFLGLYYNKGGMEKLKVGDVVDLAKGHNHAAEIANAMEKTQELINAHQPVVTAILNGLRIQALVAETKAKEPQS